MNRAHHSDGRSLALAPTTRAYRRGRDFAAWLGLTPLQRSTGGKQKLGETSRMGERTLRRLLIIGASAAVRWAMRKGSTANPWLARLLARKPSMLVIECLNVAFLIDAEDKGSVWDR